MIMITEYDYSIFARNRLTRDNIRQEHEDEERRAKHAARLVPSTQHLA